MKVRSAFDVPVGLLEGVEVYNYSSTRMMFAIDQRLYTTSNSGTFQLQLEIN